MGKIYKNSILYSGGGGSGTGGGHTIYDTDNTAMAQEAGLQFKGLKVTDDSANAETDVEAFGLNNDSLDDVTSGSIPTGFIQPAFNYSTNEQIVGKWIDGKPIYQKTYQFTSSQLVDGYVYHTGVDTLIAVEVIADRTDGGHGVPFTVDGGSNLFQSGLFTTWNSSNGEVSLYNRGTIKATTATITIKYTKV